MEVKMNADINHLLSEVKRKYSAFNNWILKPKQIEVFEALLQQEENIPIMAVLPTGYGKSVLFTLFPLLMDQVCVTLCIDRLIVFVKSYFCEN